MDIKKTSKRCVFCGEKHKFCVLINETKINALEDQVRDLYHRLLGEKP